MIAIWRLVEQGFRLHIAEQYLFQPLHAARLKLIADRRGWGRSVRRAFRRRTAITASA